MFLINSHDICVWDVLVYQWQVMAYIVHVLNRCLGSLQSVLSICHVKMSRQMTRKNFHENFAVYFMYFALYIFCAAQVYYMYRS